MVVMRGDPGEDIYDFADKPPPPPPPPLPVKVVPIRAESAASPGAPLQYRSKTVSPVRTIDSETIQNLYMPMWLLCGGTAIEMVAAFLREPRSDVALMDVGVELILGTATMLVGILLAARLRQIDLGKFWTAAFKLAAISVAPPAAADLIEPILRIIPFGGLLALAGEFVLYFALLGALFDLDESDTWFCVWVIFLVRLAFYFTILGLRAKWGA